MPHHYPHPSVFRGSFTLGWTGARGRDTRDPDQAEQGALHLLFAPAHQGCMEGLTAVKVSLHLGTHKTALNPGSAIYRLCDLGTFSPSLSLTFLNLENVAVDTHIP